jgi:hypothetical protein
MQVLKNSTNTHATYRTYANAHLEKYRDELKTQMEQRNKRPQKYQQGDLVTISVPRIDRSSTDRSTLPCKVLDISEHGLHTLGCKSGIIDTLYSASEILPLGPVTFPELDNIPNITVSVRQAARSQASSTTTGARCACKGQCTDGRCKCKKVGVFCSSGCHPNSSKCCNHE